MNSPGTAPTSWRRAHPPRRRHLVQRGDRNVAIAQEFVNRYVTVEPLPAAHSPATGWCCAASCSRGARIRLSTWIRTVPVTHDPGATQQDRYVPKRRTAPVSAQVRTDANGRFVSEFTLGKDSPPGLYHVWLWVESPAAAERAQAVDAIIEVSR